MSVVIDTKTKEPWSAVWRNRKFAEIRNETIADLLARDLERGIGPDGQVYTTELREKGEHSTQVATVDRGLSAQRHTGHDVRILYRRRITEFCFEPRDLDAFTKTFGTPDAEKLKAAQEAAQGIVESLPKGGKTAAKTQDAPSMKPTKGAKPKDSTTEG